MKAIPSFPSFPSSFSYNTVFSEAPTFHTPLPHVPNFLAVPAHGGSDRAGHADVSGTVPDNFRYFGSPVCLFTGEYLGALRYHTEKGYQTR